MCLCADSAAEQCVSVFFFSYICMLHLYLCHPICQNPLCSCSVLLHRLCFTVDSLKLCAKEEFMCVYCFLNIFLHSSSLHLTLFPVENQNIKKMKIHFPFSKNSKNQSSYIQIIFSPVSLSFSDIYLVNICLIECKTAAFTPSK